MPHSPAYYSEMADIDPKGRTDSQTALRVLSRAILAGLVAMPVYALQGWAFDRFVSVSMIGLMLAASSLLSGGTIGFLFGIPRSLQNENGSTPHEQDEKDDGRTHVGYRANTNLEQISDWLTKILVGVGLTQLTSLPDKLTQLMRYVASGMGAAAGAEVFVGTVVIYFVITGFLFGFLWTRLYLGGALREADLSAIGSLQNKIEKASAEVAQTKRELQEFKKQADLDSQALALAFRQLNPGGDLPEVSQAELSSAIAAASRPSKVQIFNQAWQVRSETWRDQDTKPKMERTIPVFTALIENDVEGRYHMNHGQLGFALKDQRQPDWAKAEAELTRAIEIRDARQESGWLFYEYNRAVCRINLDGAFKASRPSDSATQTKILEDLRPLARIKELNRLLAEEPVASWLAMNAIDRHTLTKARSRPAAV